MKYLIEGIELIGISKDSGYKNATYLIRTPDKNFIQLTELLYNTVVALQSENDLHSTAKKVSALQKKTVSVEAIQFLLDKKLVPLGIVAGSNNPVPAPDLLLGLKFRITLLPEYAVGILAHIFSFLFLPPIFFTMLGLVLGVNIWLFAVHGVNTAINQSINQPFLFLLILGLMLLSIIFHEIGHAAACSYGGGKPGRIGAGLYVAWPAFFTDLTDVYRLGRIAKIRSDIGGVYFNLVFSIFIAWIYSLTHIEALLLVILFQNLEVLHQLIPFLRLDGYYLISDIVGVPDLFRHIKPILKSFLPGQTYKSTKEMRLWIRLVVTLWICITIPAMIYLLSTMLLNSPHIAATTWQSLTGQTNLMYLDIQKKDFMATTIQALQMVSLIIPILGLGYVVFSLSKSILSLLYGLIKKLFAKKFFYKLSYHKKLSETKKPITIFQADNKSLK